MATAYMQTLRNLSRNVRLYVLSHVFFGFAYFGIFSVLFNLYLLRLGYGPEAIGAMNSGLSLAYAIACLVTGSLGKRWGVRRAMSLGMLLQVAGYLALVFAEALSGAARTAWLLCSAGVAYIGGSALLVNGDILVYGEAGTEGTGHAISVLLALWGVTAFAGSLAAGVLPAGMAGLLHLDPAAAAPYRYALVAGGVLLVPGLVLVLLIRPGEARPVDEAAKASGQVPFGPILAMVGVQFLVGVGYGAVTTFFNVYLAQGLHLATSGLGALMAVAQLLTVLASLAAPLLLTKWGNRRVFVWSCLATAACLLPVALVPHWVAAGAGYMGAVALMRFWAPALLLHRLGLVSTEWQPVINGATGMALGVSGSATALAGGYTIAAEGYPAFFVAAAAFTAVGAVVFAVRYGMRSDSAAARPRTRSVQV